MIATCQHCHLSFWRYRKDHPPTGFCSVAHATAGPTKLKGPPPKTPAEIILLMRDHRFEVHDTTSMLQDFDCTYCEVLQEKYAEALLYHVNAITREVAEAGERDWKSRAHSSHANHVLIR